jgi:hypothetical protein
MEAQKPVSGKESEMPFAANEALLNQRECAALLGYCERTLEGWRARRIGPAWITFAGRSVRYRKSDLLAFIEANLHRPEGSSGDAAR